MFLYYFVLLLRYIKRSDSLVANVICAWLRSTKGIGDVNPVVRKKIICQKGVGIIIVCFLKTYVFAQLLTSSVY